VAAVLPATLAVALLSMLLGYVWARAIHLHEIGVHLRRAECASLER